MRIVCFSSQGFRVSFLCPPVAAVRGTEFSSFCVFRGERCRGGTRLEVSL